MSVIINGRAFCIDYDHVQKIAPGLCHRVPRGKRVRLRKYTDEAILYMIYWVHNYPFTYDISNEQTLKDIQMLSVKWLCMPAFSLVHLPIAHGENSIIISLEHAIKHPKLITMSHVLIYATKNPICAPYCIATFARFLSGCQYPLTILQVELRIFVPMMMFWVMNCAEHSTLFAVCCYYLHNMCNDVETPRAVLNEIINLILWDKMTQEEIIACVQMPLLSRDKWLGARVAEFLPTTALSGDHPDFTWALLR